MAYIIKENTFTLFENDKRGNDRAPDFSGKGQIGGKEVRVSVWKRTSASGVEYMSGSISDQTPQKPQQEQPAVTEDDTDSSLPF